MCPQYTLLQLRPFGVCSRSVLWTYGGLVFQGRPPNQPPGPRWFSITSTCSKNRGYCTGTITRTVGILAALDPRALAGGDAVTRRK
ncbi:hypothetical protein VTO73DRAFT_13325 [Trametes versicolor]